MIGRAVAVGAVCLAGGLEGCGASGRDVVPESRDVVVSGAPAAGAAGGGSGEGYEYVARRPLAVVALAEARGLDAAVSRAAIERLADRLDACATDQGRRGSLVAGAARVVAEIDGDGSVSGVTVRVDPGPGIAANAVLCFVAPAKQLTFPPADAGTRGIAIEAIWGRVNAPGETH